MKAIFTKKRVSNVYKAFSVMLALLIWQGISSLPTLSVLLASPVDVVGRLFTIWQEEGFFASLCFTFVRIAGGFSLGLLAGVFLAVLAGYAKWVEVLLWPYMVTVKSVPVASFVIIILIFFRATALSVIISALMVLPIIYTNTLSGIRATDKELDRMAEVFKIPFWKKLLYVKLPQIKPFFLSGATVSLGLCWKSGVAAELIGIPTGSVGEALYQAKIYLNTADLFCWTILIILISFGFEKLVLWCFGHLFKGLERLP